MEEAVFLDLEVRRECVFVPTEKNARGHGFDVHRRGFEDAPVFGGIFDHFLVEHLVLAPAGDGVKLVETVGKGRHMEIAPDEVGGVAILLAGLEIFADHELEKTNCVVGHKSILCDICAHFKHRTRIRSQDDGWWRAEGARFFCFCYLFLIFTPSSIRLPLSGH